MPVTSDKSIKTSERLFEKAQQLMPGGVNSPVRSFRSVGGTPLFIDRAQGACIWDADDNKYLDYVASWGPMILGHAHPAVVNRIQELVGKGTSYGAPTALENELAQLVIEAVPSIEMVRFVNSGTEAVMSAIRLARAYTDRDKIIKFAGCYHGHVDDLLVKAGSGASTLGIPDSPGISKKASESTFIANYNDLTSVERILNCYSSEIAAIIVEPVAGNMGCIAPIPDFLPGIRSLADDYGVLLIFDEVMTGFRVAYGGAQELYNVMPDITTLGKIIGGGLPVGAYGASREIMSIVAPAGPMYQAGTLSGNPIAMGAGIETLKLLKSSGDTYTLLNKRTDNLLRGLLETAKIKGLKAQGYSVGSMFSIFFTDQPILNYEDLSDCDKTLFNRYFHHMLSKGIYMAPSPFESGFVSLAHTDNDIQATLAAFEAMTID